jgi:hypothetical protein
LPAIALADTKPRAVGESCNSDNECAVGSYCEKNICRPVPGGRRIIPFYFYQPGEIGHRYIPPALYFAEWDKDGKTRVQFPFFAQTEDFKEKSVTTTIPPLLAWTTKWYQKGQEGRSYGWIPVFMWRNRGDHKTGNRLLALPLLLSGYSRDDKADTTVGVFGLLAFYSREKDDVWRGLFPLVFDHQKKDFRRIIAPLIYFRRDKDSSASVVFPLFWQFSDKKAGTSHLTLLPFFHYDSWDNGRHARAFSLLGGYERNDDEHRRQLVLLTPPFYWRRDSVRDIDMLPPLYFHWKIHATGARGWVIPPVYVSKDREGLTAAVLPIFWAFHDEKTQAKTHVLLPIAAYHWKPNYQAGYFGPIYGWSHKTKDPNGGGWGLGIAPLVYAGRTGSTTYAVGLPFFAHMHDRVDGRSMTVVGPVFARKGKEGGWDGGVFPLIFAGKHGDRSYGYVPPLVFVKKSPESTTAVVGPIFGQSSKTGWRGGLAPILFFGKDGPREHQVVVPPLFIRTHDAEKQQTRMLVGGLFYHTRDRNETTDVLFPLMYLRQSPKSSLLLTPLGGWSKTDKRETIVAGLYGQVSEPKRERMTRWLFPLFVHHTQPNYNVTVVFPLIWKIHEHDEDDLAVFPFYWQIRSPSLRLEAAFPLFLHTKTKTSENVIAPLFWRRTLADGSQTMGLFPFFTYGKHAQGNGQFQHWLALPGAVYTKNDAAGTQKLVIGPFFDTRRPDGYTSGLAPLVFAWRNGTVSRALAIPLLFYRQADTAADTDFNVVGPVFWGHNGKSRQGGIAPLIFAKTNGDGTFRATLFPLFHFEQKKLGSLLITPLGGYSRYPGGYRAFVTLFYARRDSEVSSTAFWPLVYVGRNHVTGTKVDYVFPFYFRRATTDGKTLSAYTPLAWRYTTVERSVLVVTPLIWDSHWFGESRLTAFIPFFARYRKNEDQSVQWFIPPILSWTRHRAGPDGGRDFVLFPLVWRFGGKYPTTVIAPLVFDFVKPDKRVTFFLLGFHWTQNGEFTRTQVLNVHVWRGLGEKQGAWYVDIFPLTQFGRERKNDVTWLLLEGLIGYERVGRNRTLRLFWGRIPLEPLPSTTLGWWSNTSPKARGELF